ncbi:MAG: hypothetical protein HUJ31_01975, partial [Pseudomonadales bacterium]|nr:hypothetical protein [Pseudomonadales bacterium]
MKYVIPGIGAVILALPIGLGTDQRGVTIADLLRSPGDRDTTVVETQSRSYRVQSAVEMSDSIGMEYPDMFASTGGAKVVTDVEHDQKKNEAKRQAALAKMSRAVAALALSPEDRPVELVVTYRLDEARDAEELARIEALGGEVSIAYEAFPYIVLTLPATELIDFAGSDLVRLVDLDAPVSASSTASHAAAGLPGAGNPDKGKKHDEEKDGDKEDRHKGRHKGKGKDRDRDEHSGYAGTGPMVAVIDSGVAKHNDMTILQEFD